MQGCLGNLANSGWIAWLSNSLPNELTCRTTALTKKKPCSRVDYFTTPLQSPKAVQSSFRVSILLPPVPPAPADVPTGRICQLSGNSG